MRGGYYDGWTQYTITVKPAFTGIDMTISGRDRNEIKEYLYQVYEHCLTELHDEHIGTKVYPGERTRAEMEASAADTCTCDIENGRITSRDDKCPRHGDYMVEKQGVEIPIDDISEHDDIAEHDAGGEA